MFIDFVLCFGSSFLHFLIPVPTVSVAVLGHVWLGEVFGVGVFALQVAALTRLSSFFCAEANAFSSHDEQLYTIIEYPICVSPVELSMAIGEWRLMDGRTDGLYP